MSAAYSLVCFLYAFRACIFLKAYKKQAKMGAFELSQALLPSTRVVLEIPRGFLGRVSRQELMNIDWGFDWDRITSDPDRADSMISTCTSPHQCLLIAHRSLRRPDFSPRDMQDGRHSSPSAGVITDGGARCCWEHHAATAAVTRHFMMPATLDL